MAFGCRVVIGLCNLWLANHVGPTLEWRQKNRVTWIWDAKKA